ncbi:MAG: hypothetical protein U0X39_00115 [Bacteroidales bacterium]
MARLKSFLMLLMLVVFSLTSTVCEAQNQPKKGGNTKRFSLFNKIFHRNDGKVKESRGVRKKKEEQAKKEAKIKRDYRNFVSDTKKHNYEIQTPDVKERMKQNEKDMKVRDKEKKKRNTSATRSGARKYK